MLYICVEFVRFHAKKIFVELVMISESSKLPERAEEYYFKQPNKLI